MKTLKRSLHFVAVMSTAFVQALVMPSDNHMNMTEAEGILDLDREMPVQVDRDAPSEQQDRVAAEEIQCKPGRFWGQKFLMQEAEAYSRLGSSFVNIGQAYSNASIARDGKVYEDSKREFQQHPVPLTTKLMGAAMTFYAIGRPMKYCWYDQICQTSKLGWRGRLATMLVFVPYAHWVNKLDWKTSI